jgi:Flp pilus assembly pilin Flp
MERRTMMKRFLNNERGATAIEYALIMAIIFFAILVSLEPVGAALNTIFGQASTGLAAGAQP